ncbi:LOW QUALITY PROTEIN: exopolygalacturonase [Colletotrichum tofieldiae]|nr:LOW QUALITY PROTEIN: exopolygalacturonase [Colletotrichum tofieldiae]
MQLLKYLIPVVSTVGLVASYDVPPRPNIVPSPKTPTRPLPVSPPRDPSRVCIVCPKTNGDSAPTILKAAHDCNDGGTVVFMPNATYRIASRVDLTFLKHIDFAILGTIVFSDDVKYWQTNTFAYRYQNINLMWRFGGEDVNIYGLGQGLIEGLGQTWWNANVVNSTVVRPLLLGTDGLKGGSITGLNMRNSPNWFNIIANSSDILISDMNLVVEVTNKTSPAKNTDGWDTYRSDNINLYIYNISMSNASDGARIKIWPGVPPNTTGSEAGGGLGHVRNVTYEKYENKNNDCEFDQSDLLGRIANDGKGLFNLPSAISLQVKKPAANIPCQATLVIEDIVFKDFTGTTSKKNDPRVGSLICSDPSRSLVFFSFWGALPIIRTDIRVCKNIQAHDINISPPSGKPAKWTCTNMDNSLLDIDCI